MNDERLSDIERASMRDLHGKVASSAYCVAISPREDTLDPKQCMEIGAMVLLDKPIVVIVPEGRRPLPGLLRIAHKVIELRAPLSSEAGQQQAAMELAAIDPDELR